MKPREIYEIIHSFVEEIPPGSLLKAGLFDEGDPRFTRPGDKMKRDGVMIKLEKSAFETRKKEIKSYFIGIFQHFSMIMRDLRLLKSARWFILIVF